MAEAEVTDDLDWKAIRNVGLGALVGGPLGAFFYAGGWHVMLWALIGAIIGLLFGVLAYFFA